MSVLVYLRKISSDLSKIVYAYGSSADAEYDRIDIIVDVDGTITPQNASLSYNNHSSFSRLTANALRGIAKFIREGCFPENYLWASS